MFIWKSRKHVKAADCIACGQCEGVCPQHLPIIGLMQKVSERFDPWT
ncbi:MAG: 4Fe-4S dicluster domain-containing protein [Clostridia bacterium]|nr:4Fe-4S dicluster domain-containing protein [Clostridia bacterium]